MLYMVRQQGVIALAGPRGPIRRRQDSIDLWTGQIAHKAAIRPLDRDRQNALASGRSRDRAMRPGKNAESRPGAVTGSDAVTTLLSR